MLYLYSLQLLKLKETVSFSLSKDATPFTSGWIGNVAASLDSVRKSIITRLFANGLRWKLCTDLHNGAHTLAIAQTWHHIHNNHFVPTLFYNDHLAKVLNIIIWLHNVCPTLQCNCQLTIPALFWLDILALRTTPFYIYEKEDGHMRPLITVVLLQNGSLKRIPLTSSWIIKSAFYSFSLLFLQPVGWQFLCRVAGNTHALLVIVESAVHTR